MYMHTKKKQRDEIKQTKRVRERNEIILVELLLLPSSLSRQNHAIE
jgi:hypothetical protein